MLDNLSLAYHLLELKPLLENAHINKVSELKSGFVKIKLHTKIGSKDLILAPNDLFISSFSLQARHGKSNFARALKTELYNKKIDGISLNEFDRIVVIKFFKHSLILELIGAGNKVLVDSENVIISCEKNEEWADRTIKKGESYIFPNPNGLNPSKVSVKDLEKAFSKSEKDSIRTLISCVNVSPKIAEEIFHNLKIQKNSKAVDLKKNQLEKIAKSLKDFYTIKKSKMKPVLYKETPYPFKLKHLSGEKSIDTINGFIDEQASKELSKADVKSEKARKENISKLEFHKKQQALAKEKFEKQIIENQKKAELLYEHFNEVEELRTAILTAMGKDLKEKEIMYKFNSAAEKGNKTAKLLIGIDLSKKKFQVEL